MAAWGKTREQRSGSDMLEARGDAHSTDFLDEIKNRCYKRDAQDATLMLR